MDKTIKETKQNNVIDNISALQFALNNQINWQKYAEAKLLLLTTIAGTSIASLTTIVNTFEKTNDTMTFKIIIGLFAICSFISFLIGLLSIILTFKLFKKSTYLDYSIILISWRYVMDKSVFQADPRSQRI